MNEAFGTRERVSMRKPKMFLPALALGVAGAISAAAPSLAEPITYTMDFIGTGCLGPSSVTLNCTMPTFSQVNVALTMVNDTGNIMYDTTQTPPLYEINGTATVSVNGGAPATFMDQMQFYTDSASILGLYDASVNPPFGLDIVDLFSSALGGYQLGGLTAPITDTAQLGLGQPTPFPGFELTSGDFFLLTGLGTPTTSDATFTATVAAVPAPPIGRGLSVALAVGGMLFGANLLRRRFRNPLT
jgi:hypothetical protein